MQNFEGFKYTFILALASMVSLCQNNRDGHACRHLVAEISGNFFLLWPSLDTTEVSHFHFRIVLTIFRLF